MYHAWILVSESKSSVRSIGQLHTEETGSQSGFSTFGTARWFLFVQIGQSDSQITIQVGCVRRKQQQWHRDQAAPDVESGHGQHHHQLQPAESAWRWSIVIVFVVVVVVGSSPTGGVSRWCGWKFGVDIWRWQRWGHQTRTQLRHVSQGGTAAPRI